jgi:RNA-directed DNA polymerase
MITLIKKLNEILRGWANYHRYVVASDAFRRVDTYVHEQLWRMLRRRHSNKSKKWLFKKYWRAHGMKGVFVIIRRYKDKSKLYHVICTCSICIRRHIKIKANANPYLPEYGSYFWKRRHIKDAKLWRELTARQMRLAFN